MRKALFWSAVVVSVVACKKADKPADKKAPPAKKTETPTTKPPVADAAAAAAVVADAAAEPDAPDFDEAGFRAGKKTGLGAAGEKPEVATEELVVALADGKLAPDGLIDPAQGFYEQVILPGAEEKANPDIRKRHCGKQAGAALVSYAKTYVSEQQRWKDINGPDGEQTEHVITCTNQYIAAPDPAFGSDEDDVGDPTGGHAFSYANCESPGAGEYDAAYELIFAPDKDRGLRAVGVLVWEVGAMPAWSEFATEALKPGKNCK